MNKLARNITLAASFLIAGISTLLRYAPEQQWFLLLAYMTAWIGILAALYLAIAAHHVVIRGVYLSLAIGYLFIVVLSHQTHERIYGRALFTTQSTQCPFEAPKLSHKRLFDV